MENGEILGYSNQSQVELLVKNCVIQGKSQDSKVTICLKFMRGMVKDSLFVNHAMRSASNKDNQYTLNSKRWWKNLIENFLISFFRQVKFHSKLIVKHLWKWWNDLDWKLRQGNRSSRWCNLRQQRSVEDWWYFRLMGPMKRCYFERRYKSSWKQKQTKKQEKPQLILSQINNVFMPIWYPQASKIWQTKKISWIKSWECIKWNHS